MPAGAARDALKRAECMSVVCSLYEVLDRLAPVRTQPTLELRQSAYGRALVSVPLILATHERLVAGPFYYGDKVRSAHAHTKRARD